MSDYPSIKTPHNIYGSLEPVMQALRANNPQDLSMRNWREANPTGTHAQWRKIARACLTQGLHYDPGKLDLKAKTLSVEDRGDFTLERIEFNTTPWHRLEGYLLLPKNISKPVPGMVALHAWGGPLCFGKDRIVNSGRDHELLVKHREGCYDGNYLAEEYVKQGYGVIVIDAHHFGSRFPRGLRDIEANEDPFAMSVDECNDLDARIRGMLDYGLAQLYWAGTTWCGLNFYDDSRCIDYLLSRPEIDGDKIGVTGLSGGGWRTNIMAALDDRVKASVSVGWMTTTDMQQVFNVRGAIGTFCCLPGVWNRLDIPDLTAMGAPGANMVVLGKHDDLFPAEGVAIAKDHIRDAYAWAGQEAKHCFYEPDSVHCYNSDIQAKAFAWFEQHLKR